MSPHIRIIMPIAVGGIIFRPIITGNFQESQIYRRKLTTSISRNVQVTEYSIILYIVPFHVCCPIKPINKNKL